MVELVVVGAGIVGSTAGSDLARSGTRVTVVDRADPGTATNASPGIIRARGSFRVDRIIPSIESASLIETRVGSSHVTPDRIPHLGWASSNEGLLPSSDRGCSTVHRTTHRCGVDRVAA